MHRWSDTFLGQKCRNFVPKERERKHLHAEDVCDMFTGPWTSTPEGTPDKRLDLVKWILLNINSSIDKSRKYQREWLFCLKGNWGITVFVDVKRCNTFLSFRHLWSEFHFPSKCLQSSDCQTYCCIAAQIIVGTLLEKYCRCFNTFRE